MEASNAAVQSMLASRPMRYGAGLSLGTIVIIAIRLLNACTHVHDRGHQNPTPAMGPRVEPAGADGTSQLN